MAETEWEEADVRLPAVRQEERAPEPAHRYEERGIGAGERRLDPWNVRLKGVRCPVDRCPGPVEIKAVTITVESGYDSFLYSWKARRVTLPRHHPIWCDVDIRCSWCRTETSMRRVPIEGLLYLGDECLYHADLGGNPGL